MVYCTVFTNFINRGDFTALVSVCILRNAEVTLEQQLGVYLVK
jgi:hypothetical protein